MYLSKLIVKWLELIIEIGLWFFLASSFIVGFVAGNGFFGSLFSGFVALIFGGVFSALIFGGFIVLKNIDNNLEVLRQNAVTKQTTD